MSNEPKNSPLTSAWRGALVLCGIAVLLKVTVELLASIWAWLVTGTALVVIVAAIFIGVRWWRESRRW